MKKKTRGILMAAVCLSVLCVLLALLLRPQEQDGHGNAANYGYVAEHNDLVYLVNPTDERLVAFDGTNVVPLTDTGAMHLTVIEDALYYVSTDTGYFMQLLEGEEDKVVLDYGVGNPIYKNGTLYFYSGMESLVYSVTVKNGVFSDPVCLSESLSTSAFAVGEDTLYYIPMGGDGLWAWSLTEEKEPVMLSAGFCGQPVAQKNDVYFWRMDEGKNGIYVCKNGKAPKLLTVAQASCLNVCGRELYYTDISGKTNGVLYRMKTSGKGTPTALTTELATETQIVGGYIYYRTLAPSGGMQWKRIPLGKTEAEARTVTLP